MRVAIHECKHCGVEYYFQWSGNYDAVDVPREHRDEEYCPECKKAIVDALNTIPKKFNYQFVKTDEVSIDTILQWENEKVEDHRKQMEEGDKLGLVVFPMIKEVFPSLYNIESGESSVSGRIIGRGEFAGKNYSYFYWPSKINEASIAVEKKINLETNEELKYKMYDKH